MDLFQILCFRIEFIEFFYDTAVARFVEMKRKIEAGESPYVYQGPPEDCDGTEFLSEWQEAEAGYDALGMSALAMLQGAFHSYLQECVKNIGGDKLLERVPQMKQGNWFANYEVLFKQQLGCDWAASGADLQFLEHMILTRNDFQHNNTILQFLPATYQADKHQRKYPQGEFCDDFWPDPGLLRVTKEKLAKAIGQVKQLCKHLDDDRVARSF
jgi:hypothetical protein